MHIHTHTKKKGKESNQMLRQMEKNVNNWIKYIQGFYALLILLTFL